MKSIGLEIVDKVLTNNQDQHMLLSMEEKRSKETFSTYVKLINELVSEAVLNIEVDAIPSQLKLEMIESQKKGLPRPLLALLQSHMKIKVYEELLFSDLIESNFFSKIYQSYFPPKIMQQYKKEAIGHPLKKEILAMLLTNKLINFGGVLFFKQIEETSAAKISEISRVYLILLE